LKLASFPPLKIIFKQALGRKLAQIQGAKKV